MSIRQACGLFFCSAFLFLFACDRQPVFHLKGVVSDATDKVLYLEHIGLSSAEVIDSVKLGKEGKFSFKQARPEAPDFYRLRLDGNAINIAADSTEQIVVKANAKDFATGYTVEGSESNSRIRELTLLQLKTDREYAQLKNRKKDLTPEEYEQQLIQLTDGHKQEATKYILDAPGSAVSYFALFQQIDGLLIFDPYDKKDNKIYSMVATSWDMLHGESQRARHLHALTLQALKVIRGNRVNPYENVQVKDALSYFEVELPDLQGKIVKLSDVVREGKVILLDFTVYQSRFSPARNLDLRALYGKYRDKGFEIFQVALDSDLHLWQNAAQNIPWICVRDPESVYSRIAAIYNVKNVPVAFLLNKKGEIVKRIESEDIEAELKKVL